MSRKNSALYRREYLFAKSKGDYPPTTSLDIHTCIVPPGGTTIEL